MNALLHVEGLEIKRHTVALLIADWVNTGPRMLA